MRLTSSTIKQLIKEELSRLFEEEDDEEEISYTRRPKKDTSKFGEESFAEFSSDIPVDAPRDLGDDDETEPPTRLPASDDKKKKAAKTKTTKTKTTKAKGSFSREQEGLRRKINQLKKAGKIDKATWRKARNALYKSPKAANAVLQKAGAAAKTKPQGPEGQRVASAGRPSATGAKKVERKPTAKDMETARHLRSALVKLAGANYKWGPMSLKEQKHPQFDRILQAVYQAAQKGHMAAKLALESLGVMKKDVQVASAGRPVTGGDPEKAPEKKAAQKAWYEIQKECIDKCEEKYPATISTRQKKCVAVCKKQGSKNLRAQTKKQKAVQSTKVTKATQVPKVPAA